MGEATNIGWTHHTWNPWRGCTKISPGCTNCYMFTEQRRWGNDPAVVARTKTWGQPAKWQWAAWQASRRELVFTCSWSDWFHHAADAWRDEAWSVIWDTPNLVYQILTKRADRIHANLPRNWGDQGYSNAWLGVSVEDQKTKWRIGELRKSPARVRFLSIEPLLEPLGKLDLRGIDWVIVGGESGPGHRQTSIAAMDEVAGQCIDAMVKLFVKQDSGPRPELQGRIPDWLWRYKQIPDLVA